MKPISQHRGESRDGWAVPIQVNGAHSFSLEVHISEHFCGLDSCIHPRIATHAHTPNMERMKKHFFTRAPFWHSCPLGDGPQVPQHKGAAVRGGYRLEISQGVSKASSPLICITQTKVFRRGRGLAGRGGEGGAARDVGDAGPGGRGGRRRCSGRGCPGVGRRGRTEAGRRLRQYGGPFRGGSGPNKPPKMTGWGPCPGSARITQQGGGGQGKKGCR